MEESHRASLTIEQCRAGSGVQVLALRRTDGEIIANPDGDLGVELGCGLVVIGESQLEYLERDHRD